MTTLRQQSLQRLDDDIEDHLRRETEANIARGMTPDEAARAARRAFGSTAFAKEEARAVWIPWWRDALAQDVRYAWRTMRRAKEILCGAVLTLALGLGGAIVMFALVRGVLLRPMPVEHEARLVVSWRAPRSGPAAHVPYRSADVEAIGRTSRSFERVSGVGYNGAFSQDWRMGETWVSAKTAVVMGGLFDVVGVRPHIGRLLTAEDDRRGAERLVLLSHAAWIRWFASSPDVLGQTLVL
jgi:hypothetical protein